MTVMGVEALSLPAMLAGALLAGLGGSVHCLGMCGPIAALLGAQAAPRGTEAGAGETHDGLALKLQTPAQPAAPIAATAVQAGTMSPRARRYLPWVYQLGRLSGYAVLAVIGAGLIALLSQYSGFQLATRWARILLALILLLIGAYLLFNWRVLDFITRIGQGPWRYIRRWASVLLPPRHLGQAFVLGLLWGWLPCGMVYAMLGVAWTTASPLQAAAIMLAFGLGTTPMMLGAVSSSAWLRARLGQGGLRRVAGILLMAAAVFSALQLWPGSGAHQHHHPGTAQPADGAAAPHHQHTPSQ